MDILKLKEQHKELLVKVGVAAGSVAFLFLVMIQPAFRDITFLRRNIQDSQTRLKLYREIKGFKTELSGMEKPLAASTDRGMVVGKISDIANRSDLNVQRLTPKTASGDHYIVLTVEIDAESSFFSLIKFLNALEILEPPVAVKNISLARQQNVSSKETAGLLKLRLNLETYLVKVKRKGKAA